MSSSHGPRSSHQKHYCQCHLPRKTLSKAWKKKGLRNKFVARNRKLPIRTYLFSLFTFWVGCYVKSLLHQTYLKAWWTFLCCLIVTQDVSKKATRMFRAKARKIIANESTVDRDSSIYMAHFGSDSFCMGIDTLCTQTLSGNKNHLRPATLQWKKFNRHCRRVRDCRWRHLNLSNWGRQWPNWHHQDPLQFLCAWSEVASVVFPTLGGDSQRQSPDQVWNKNLGGLGWVHFVMATTNKQKRVHHDTFTNMPIFWTAPGSIQYQAFEATFMACDASHLFHHIPIGLWGDVDLDPAAFLAEE